MVKQLKNRYNDPNKHKRFILNIDRSRMRLSDAEAGEQDLVQDTPAFDKSETAERFADFKL